MFDTMVSELGKKCLGHRQKLFRAAIKVVLGHGQKYSQGEHCSCHQSECKKKKDYMIVDIGMYFK
jgi:hypothetical protein